MHLLTSILAPDDRYETALSALESALAELPTQVDGPTLARIEVPLTRALTAADALSWLAPWRAISRSFWADREDSLVMAGVGEAWHVGGLGWTLDEGLTALQGTLRNAPPRLRLLGGVCFHGELRSHGPWKAFGAWRFALPRLELGRDAGGAWLAVHVYGATAEWPAQLAAATGALADGFGAGHAEMAQDASQQALPTAQILHVQDQPDRAGWRDALAEALEALAGTELDKVVLARQRCVRLTESPDAIALLLRLARREPRAFRFCLQPHPSSAFVGASPERLLRLSGVEIMSEALAGTRPRGDDAQTDAAFAAALVASSKDRHEHQLVADMVAETLRRVCDGVSLSSNPDIMALSHVQHLHTPISARLREGQSVADLLVALHPTPAVGGTPRLQARRLIERLEPFQRGLYAAPVGWVGGGGDAEFTVAIRSALVQGDTLSLFSGAGLVLGSQADAEWAEIDGKIEALWQAFGLDSAHEA